MTATLPQVPDFHDEGADELLARDLPPIQMVVGDVIPAGLLLLAGDPKAGKTLLAQDLALSIATGRPAWGGLEVPQGRVLYIAREGGEIAFRNRLEIMLEGAAAPSEMRIAYESEKLGGRLESQLESWMTKQPDTRLVVIDTYAAVAPETRGVNRHQEDYNALAGLADCANRHPGTLYLVIHHTRKAEGEDVMHKISGSQGMTAATDGNAVLSRHTAARQCVLSVRPRNAEESELVIERGDNLRWQLVGNNERAQLSRGRQQILTLLDATDGGLTPKEVAEMLEMKPESARKYLSEMVKQRQVCKDEHGVYRSSGSIAA